MKMKAALAILLPCFLRAATPPSGSLQAFLATEAANRQYIAATVQAAGGLVPKPAALGANLQAIGDVYYGFVQSLNSYVYYFSPTQAEAQVDMLAAPRSNGYLGLTTANLAVVSPGGTGYAINDLVTIGDGGGNGSGAVVKVLSLTGTGIYTFSVVNQGTGYTPAMGVATTTTGMGSGATFNIAASGNPTPWSMPGLGAQVLTINLDPQIYVDETQGTARTNFESVLTYIQNTYPGVQIDINASFIADSIGSAQDAIGSMYGCATGFNQATPPVYQDPTEIATCVATNTYTWLSTGTCSLCSVYGYLALKYASMIRRFTVVHEPTSVNTNTGCTMTSVCGPSKWATAINTMVSTVTAYNSTAKVCVAFDSNESTYQSDILTDMSPAPAFTCVGYDSFTDNLAQANKDLGTIDTMMTSAAQAGFEVYANAIGPPAWVPTGQTQSDGKSYWGVGNCGWLATDLFRQWMVSDSLYFAYKGATEISYFVELPATWCVFLAPDTTNADKSTSISYITNDVVPNVTHRTPFFWVAYDIFGWSFGQTGGGQIAAEGGFRPI